MSAKQLALKRAPRLMVWVILEYFLVFGLSKTKLESAQNRKKKGFCFPVL
jgi:hypothetical protein